jgi:hypothetical protein
MLTVVALVPKKFVSKMKMKQEKKNTPVAQETLTTSLGPFFRSVSLVLITSQSSVIILGHFMCPPCLYEPLTSHLDGEEGWACFVVKSSRKPKNNRKNQLVLEKE